MYGDGNSTKLVRDIMNSTDQIMEGVKQSAGIDLSSMLAGFVGGKLAESNEKTVINKETENNAE